MTRENKLALVVGFGLILFVGILISDHFSVARSQVPADLSGGLQDPLAQNHESNRDLLDLGTLPSEPEQPALQPGMLAVNSGVIPHSTQQPSLLDQSPGQASGSAPDVQETQVIAMGSTVNPLSDPLEDPADSSLQEPESTPLVDGFTTQPVQPEVALVEVQFHEVRGGESLFAICRRYYDDTSLVKALASFNKINDPAALKAGHRLMIPKPEALGGEPVRVAGRTTESGALRQVDDSKTRTPARSDTKVAARKTHTVRKGENLSAIAQRVYGNRNKWRKLLELNRDQLTDPDELKAGMVLRF